MPAGPSGVPSKPPPTAPIASTVGATTGLAMLRYNNWLKLKLRSALAVGVGLP